MSAAIIKFIASFAAKQIWSQIQNNLFKPNPNPIDLVLGGQARIEQLIRDLDYKAQIREPMNRIYYWTERIQVVVDDLIRTNSSPASVKAYQELLSALRNDTAGVRFQTFSLYIAVVGDPNNPLRPEAMLSFWADNAYKKLADASNMRYFMKDYVTELDTAIAAVIALLHHGLALSFFIATDAVDAERLQSECITRVNTFRNTLFNTHYPPALRQFKPAGYDDAGLMLTQRWFDFYKDDDGKRYMTIHAFWVRQLALSGGGPKADPRSFRFVAAVVSAPLGALQMHAQWAAPPTNGTRIKFYDDMPSGMKRTFAYTNSLHSGKTYDILFKLIPLAVTGNARDRAPVRLVPYLESSLAPTRADQNDTFGNIWKLTVTNSPR